MSSAAPVSSASARPASTVIIVRNDFSILLIQRNKGLSFFGGAYAFPGGRVEPSDLPPEGASISMPITAVRELPWDGHSLPVADLGVPDLQRVYSGYLNAAQREVEEEVAVRLETNALIPWARWVTPAIEPKRYDTLFFLARWPSDAAIEIDGGETVLHRWLTPVAALEANARGEISLPPPTQVTLAELAAVGSAEALFSRDVVVPEILPQLVSKDEALWLVLPGDPWHDGELLRPWPAGLPTRAKISDGGIRFA